MTWYQILGLMGGATLILKLLDLFGSGVKGFFARRDKTQTDNLHNSIAQRQLESDADAAKKKFDLDAFNAILAPLERRLDKVETKNDLLQKELDAAKEQLASERGKRTDLDTQVNALNGKVQGLEKLLGEKDVEIGALKTERNSLREELRKVKNRVDELEDKERRSHDFGARIE